MLVSLQPQRAYFGQLRCSLFRRACLEGAGFHLAIHQVILPAIAGSEASNLAPLASRVVNPILYGTESLLQCCIHEVSNSSSLLALLFSYRISALGVSFDQLTLKLVAVTGLTVLLDPLRFLEFCQKSYGLHQPLDCGLGLNISFQLLPTLRTVVFSTSLLADPTLLSCMVALGFVQLRI